MTMCHRFTILRRTKGLRHCRALQPCLQTGRWILTFFCLLLLISKTSYAGSRFTFSWRQQPSCNFNPYDVGTLAVVAGEKAAHVVTLVSFVSANISNDGFYKTVSREKIEAVLKEQALGLSGHIDVKTAANTGNLLGAQSLFVVELENLSNSKNYGEGTAKGTLWVKKDYVTMYEGEEGKKPKYGVTLDAEIPYKYASISLSASGGSSLVKVEDGKALCSAHQNVARVVKGVLRTETGKVPSLPEGVRLSEDGWKYVEKELQKTDIKSWLKENSVEIVDMEKMPDKEQLQAGVLSSLSFSLANPMLPFVRKVEREVGDGKTLSSKQAVLKAKAEDWEEAGKLWKLATQTEPRDHDAWAGLGVYYERKEMRTKAKFAYSKARELAPKNKGFPNWLKEVEMMLNDISGEETPSSSDPLSKYANFPYVVAFDKKTKEIKINAKGRQAQIGDIIKIFLIKPLVDPVTGEVLEVTENIKAKAQITATSEKLWTALLTEGKDVNIEDKVDVVK